MYIRFWCKPYLCLAFVTADINLICIVEKTLQDSELQVCKSEEPLALVSITVGSTKYLINITDFM